MTESLKRKAVPIRYRKLKGNTRIVVAEQVLAELLGVPTVSLKLQLPGGRKARSDATIRNLRDAHAKEDARLAKRQAKKAGLKHTPAAPETPTTPSVQLTLSDIFEDEDQQTKKEATHVETGEGLCEQERILPSGHAGS